MSHSVSDAVADATADKVSTENKSAGWQRRSARATNAIGDAQPNLTAVQDAECKDLQRDILAVALVNSECAAEVIDASGYFDTQYRPIADAMAESQQRGEPLSSEAFDTWLSNQHFTPGEKARTASAFKSCQLRSEGRRSRDQQQQAEKVAEIFGTPVLPKPSATLMEFAEKLTRLKEQFPIQTYSKATPTKSPALSLDALPLPIRQLVSYFAGALSESPNVRHVAAALFCCAAVIGKRIQWTNREQTYYCNLFVVGLGMSGDAKSNLVSAMCKLLDGIAPFKEPTATTMEAFVRRYGSSMSQSDFAEEDRRDRREAEIRLAHGAKIDSTANLVIDEFAAFLAQLIPTEQAIRNSRLFCRLADNRTVDMDTVTQGARMIFDCCISMFGVSQADPYNAEVRTARFQTAGVSGRLLPCNSEAMQISMATMPTSREQAQDILRGMADLVKSSASIAERIGVDFVDDCLTKGKTQARSFSIVRDFRDAYPTEWMPLENKILIQTSKVAVIFAFANAYQQQQARTDPLQPWQPIRQLRVTLDDLKLPWALVASLHVSNAGYQPQMTENSEKIDKIKRVIRRFGNPTTSMLYQFTNMDKRELEPLLVMLSAEGQIVGTEVRKKSFRWSLP